MYIIHMTHYIIHMTHTHTHLYLLIYKQIALPSRLVSGPRPPLPPFSVKVAALSPRFLGSAMGCIFVAFSREIGRLARSDRAGWASCAGRSRVDLLNGDP